jgi:DNA-binding NarL/FixJ family response regulator
MSVSVLVVDDTDHVRDMLSDMLTLDGFDVVGSAHDGVEAVRLCQETRPDVVVMDLRMPGMDGLESTRLIRAAIPDQAVLVYTAYIDDTVRAEAEAAGAAMCLSKLEGLQSLERELDRLGLDLEDSPG